jgi:phospholipid-binding lipoprotein MlaA
VTYRVLVLSVCFLVSACTTLEGDDYGVYDPYESVNRASYRATDGVDKAVLLPVAKGYDRVTPSWLQRGVLNVFLNLRTIGSSINGFLQGKTTAGSTDLARVVVNSTLGVAGFFDVAGTWGLQYQDEDFGQTLAVWGVQRSRYVYVPFLGPSTWRDLPSTILRNAIPRILLGGDYHWGMSVADIVSARADLISATQVRDASALDPYAFTRDAYFQRRKYLIFDGDPPVEDFFDDFEE